MRRRVAPAILVALLLASTIPVHAAKPELRGPPVAPPAGDPNPSADPGPPADPGVATDPAPSLDPVPPADPTPATGSIPPAPVEPVVPPVGPDLSATLAAAGSTLDASGRFIVVLEPGTDALAESAGHARKNGVRPEKVFEAVDAYSAALTPAQQAAIAADPDVTAVVPDEIIELTAQSMPTGVARIGGRVSPAALIDGVDQRVDADVAVVDTGIDPTHSDLNVVGGYNCSTSDSGLWRDAQGHGTHVAGTIGAKDDAYGVVGVAPGVRLWAVKILDDTGTGLLSWYVCGLDWIAAQRDPADASRPLIEAVNMSVAKWGSDDGACGAANADVLHQAICRLTGTDVTVVAAAANDSGNAALRVPAAYDEVITVSALADTDGRPGGSGGDRCFSWGTYDADDTFADFSNYGPDVDLIAPGKCIWSTLPGERFGWSSGTSMAAPHVTGAVALLKASRSWLTNTEVVESLRYLGNYNWRTSTDPDGRPDILLDVSRLGGYGDFSIGLPGALTAQPGQTFTIPVAINRTPSHFERVTLSAGAPADVAAAVDRMTAFGFDGTSANLTVSIPSSTFGRHVVTVSGTEHGRTRQATIAISIVDRLAGADRFATAAAVSAATFGPGVGTAYIASAWSFPDALAGAAAAGTVKGPVLLAAATGPLHPSTAAELARLGPARIVVLGGTGVVSDAVLLQLRAFAPAVTRLAGADRFATAAAVSAATFGPGVGTAYIASAWSFPDALAGAAAAGTAPGPILLSAAGGTLHPATAAELARLRPGRIVVLGGAGVIGDGIVAQLRTFAPTVTRLAGADRFATAAAVSAATFGPGVGTAYIASAWSFPDALAGAAAAGTVKGPVLLAAATGPLHPSTAAELARLGPARIVVLGGTGVVSDAVYASLGSYLASP